MAIPAALRLPRTRRRRQFSAQLGDREARLRIGNHPSDSNHQRSRIRARSRFAHLSWLYRLCFIDRGWRFLACGGAEMARPDTKNTTKYWWDKHISGLSLMHADFTSHDFAPHTHDAFVIAVTELGGARIKSRGVTEVALSSRLFVSNPEEPQSSWMGDSPRWRYRSMYLTQAAIDVVAEGLGIESGPFFTGNMIGDADPVRGFASLHQALEVGADRFREHELLISAFGHLFGRRGSGGNRIEPAPRDSILVRRIADLVRERFA